MSGTRSSELKLDMTPMIDCVFQLLIFFIITLKPEDLLAHLDVSRPTVQDENPTNVVPVLQIGVYADGVTVNDRMVRFENLGALLKKLARASETQTVLIKCAPDALHEQMVAVLDLCSSAKLRNLSVMSL
jgi:biopolymer transport protein ExbD